MNPQPDYKDFYATLAAVSSGIVGLLGAVLGSRLIDHIPRLRDERATVNRAISVAAYNFYNFNRNLDMYLQALIEERTRLAAAMDRDEQTIRVEREFLYWELGVLNQPRDADPETRAKEIAQKYNEAQRLDQIFPTLTGALHTEDISGWIALLETERDRYHDDRAKEQLQQRIDDLRGLLNRNIIPFQARMLPPSFWTIFIILALFILAGIVGPLLIIPGPPLFSRPFIFPLVLLGLLLLVGYFASQILLVVRLGRLEWP